MVLLVEISWSRRGECRAKTRRAAGRHADGQQTGRRVGRGGMEEEEEEEEEKAKADEEKDVTEEE
ncbi:hypothetical protein E2C01_072764 [Portunus trituberculatus]|uniref:Uncharacterized protein n=1 Tax=Portunus trituberculatus TaxID=210409 RepID=A0A5B7I8Q8_PORTR|nr:hypothetical protein [Portunus trituberculatus]